jgi:predicted permease
MLADIRFAVRGFLRTPAFTLVAVLSLALGIGANTAIFSLVNAILLRTLPVREPDRLVIFTLPAQDRFGGANISVAAFQQIREKNTVLEDFAGWRGLPVTLSGSGFAERVDGTLVSGNYFETLGVQAILGRVFTAQDDRVPDSPPVCVISYGFWLRRFAGDHGAIGQKILLNGQPFTVLGVTPKAFMGLNPNGGIDIYVPLMAAGMSQFRNVLQPFGRLKRGVSIARAQASLDALYHQFETPLSPATRLADIRVILQPGGRGSSPLRKQYEHPLWILMAVVALVLSIACANLANLLMARASGRAKEIAVRLALGAGRKRLIRQLVIESACLTIAGATLGVVLAYSMDRALVALAPPQYGGRAPIIEVNPDWRVLSFTLGVVVLVALLSGLAPAMQATRPDMAAGLKRDTGMRAHGQFSFTNALVVAQVAISLVLLIGAGLFLRNLHNLKSVDPGLDPDRLIVLTMEPAYSGYSAAASQVLFTGVAERARNLPGVVSASLGIISPLSSEFVRTRISVPGYLPRSEEPPLISVNWIEPNYFKTLRAPMVVGRAFDEQDGRAKKVAIVNERTAGHYWPNESPIGKHVLIGSRDRDDCEIVGVVKDVKSESLREAAEPTVYMPFTQNRMAHVTLHVRVSGDTRPVISALLGEIHSIDPNVPAFNITTMAAQLDRTIALDRLMAALTVLFGCLGVALAAVGLYGVMTFTVATRTREIGIRMALGADRVRVLKQVLGESAILAILGILMGVPAALWASRTVGSFLYGLSATDPLTYTALAMMLGAIALGAAWTPARRAASVDPMVALRYE